MVTIMIVVRSTMISKYVRSGTAVVVAVQVTSRTYSMTAAFWKTRAITVRETKVTTAMPPATSVLLSTVCAIFSVVVLVVRAESYVLNIIETIFCKKIGK